MTKQDVLFRLYALVDRGDDLCSKLEPADSNAVADVVSKFEAGKRVKDKAEDLTRLLDLLADAAGGPETADMLVAERQRMDDLTRQEAQDGFDFVQEFGRDVVRAWLEERDQKTPKKASATKLNGAVNKFKRTSFDDVDGPVHEAGAKREQEIEQAEAQAEAKARESAASKATTARTRKSVELTITEPVRVKIEGLGKTFTGKLNPDATVTYDDVESNEHVRGQTYQASKASKTALQTSWTPNPWNYFRFERDGQWVPTDALRVNPKGYATPGTRKRAARQDSIPEDPAKAVEVLRVRVQVLQQQLDKAQAKLTQAEQVLAEKVKQDLAQDLAGADALKQAQEPTPSEDPDGVPLVNLKKKALLKLAADLKIKGRSKLSTEDLIDAIQKAQAA